MLQVNFEDVVAAGRVLFGPAFCADGQAWRLDLKTTYRRRALETHPDRARAVGRAETELSLEFRRVSEAYRVLSQLAAGPLPTASGAHPQPSSPPRPPRGPHRPATRAAKEAAEPSPRPAPPPRSDAAPGDAPGHRVRYAVQPEAMPRRKLRFAEFLYYSGRVPWTAFVEAISWQRKQRPPVGRIAVEWGFLEPEDVARIMEERRARGAQQVPFGEFAVRMGYLTSFQLLAILGRQLRMQRRIGEFFVEHGFIDATEIDDLRRRIFRHNVHWRE